MDNSMAVFLIEHWEKVMIGFFVLEKIVKLSPAKWDDILVDGIKAIILKLKAGDPA